MSSGAFRGAPFFLSFIEIRGHAQIFYVYLTATNRKAAMKRYLLPLLLLVAACTQNAKNEKYQPSPESVELNNRACSIISRNSANIDSIEYAIELWDQAIAADSLNTRPYINKAQWEGSLGRYDDAYHSLRRATQIDPTLVEATVGMGMVKEMAGDSLAAQQIYRTALAAHDRKYGTPSNDPYPMINRAFIELLLYQTPQVDTAALNFTAENGHDRALVNQIIGLKDSSDRETFRRMFFSRIDAEHRSYSTLYNKE